MSASMTPMANPRGDRQVLQDLAANRILSPKAPANTKPIKSVVASKTSNAVNKRSHASLEEPTDAVNPDDIILSGEEDGEYEYTMSCDEVRRKLRALFDSGEVKITHWQRDHHVNSQSYGNFMRLKGPWSGINNQTFDAGYKYFKKRELAGVPAPHPNKKRKSGETGSTKGAPDVSDIELPGEEDDKVPVYDSCDEIRRKISAHLRDTSITQAAFLRVLAAQFHTVEKKLQSKQLADFRAKKGADHGNTSAIFYAGYVYFEKLRLKEGKPKTKHRQEMERLWSHQGGFDVSRPGVSQRGCWLGPGENFKVDAYGMLTITGRR